MSLILMTGSQMSSFKCQLSHSTVLGASSSLMISRDPGAKLKHGQGLHHRHDLPVIPPSLFCCLTPCVPVSFPHRLAPLSLAFRVSLLASLLMELGLLVATPLPVLHLS